MVKNLPAKQATRVQFLGREVSLEKETARATSVFLLGKAMDRGAWRATGRGVAKSDTT